MEELREAFLIDSISKLNNLQNDLRSEDFSPELERELFRTLHTIKGTAQTFGFAAAAQMAHTLENLLAAAKNDSVSAKDLKFLLPEGITVLIKSLAEKNFQIPASFAENFQSFQSDLSSTNHSNDYLSGIPETISAQLSNQEKTALGAALEDGKKLSVLEIGFDASSFADEFKSFREKLDEKGEIIATLPSAKFAAQGKIGFQIVLATVEETKNAIGNSPAEINFQINRTFPSSLPAVLAQIVRHGKNLAESLGKTIEFETFLEAETVSAQTLKTIFDALLHLVRNAVDHGIEQSGKIKIQIASGAGGISLKVSDDGRGIDLEKVRRKAVEKNLIDGDADLSEQEILNLIFAHGFSTGETISEISGRGVGLDVVKDLAEKAGGEILVQSETGRGTTFEILLKKNETRRK